MEKTCSSLHLLLLSLGLAAGQGGTAFTDVLEKAEGALPNWLTGIIAVAVFLFLVFVTFLVNKAWCETPSKAEAVLPSEYAMTNGSSPRETSLDAVRSIDGPNAYENVIVHQMDEKVTVM